jgi:hypothetical protein
MHETIIAGNFILGLAKTHDSFDNESLKVLPFRGLKRLMILNYTNRCPALYNLKMRYNE